jgi:PAS domain S-box-containing protein
VDIHDQVMMRETLEEAVAKRTAELRDREERLTLLFEHAPDAYFLLSSKMTVVAVNRAAEQLTGHPRDKLIGSNAHQLGLILPSCDKALRTRSLKELHSTPSAVHEIVIVREGGQVCEVAMRTVRLVIDGKRHFLMQGRDVSDRRRLERKLLKIADLERQRIGQELHDGLCQQLVGTAFAVKTLERSLLKHSKRDAGKVSEIGQLLSQLIQQARTISTGLAPVNASQEGFVIALNELAIQMNKVGSIRCRFLGGRVLINDNHIATHLYRIAQQAVTNAFQHAQPTDVVIELLDQPDVIVMIVRDDGVGIPSDACRRGGFGLTNMQYRARMIQATLEIAPGNPNGTIVSCTVPKIVLQSKYSRTAA